MDENLHWSASNRLLSVENFKLWAKNPRLPTNKEHKHQKQVIEDLFLSNEKKFKALLTSIVEKGFLYFDTIVVCKLKESHEYFTVLEGNRRIAALKVLLDPTLAPKNYMHTVKRLSNKIDKDSIRKIRVAIAPNMDEALPYITQRHTGQEVLPWDTDNKRNWIVTVYEFYNGNIDEVVEQTHLTVSEVYKAINSSSLLNYAKTLISDYDISNSFTVTNFERFIFSKDGRDHLGIEFIEDNVKISYGLPYFNDVLIKLVNGIMGMDGKEKIDSRSLHDSDDIKEVINTRLQSNIDKNKTEIILKNGKIDSNIPTIPEQVVVLNEKLNDKNTDNNRKTNKIENRLIPKNLKLNTNNLRLQRVFEELQLLPLEKYKVSVAVVLRVLIDLATTEYIEAENLKSELVRHYGNDHNKAMGFANRLKFVVERSNIDKEVKKIINKLLNENNFISLDTMNSYVHGQYTPLTIEMLRHFWESICIILKEILDIEEISN